MVNRIKFKSIQIKVASSKVVKHKKTSCDNQHVFMSFVFHILDSLALEVVDLLKEFKWSCMIHSNIVSPMFVNVVFRGLILSFKKV
jgi:hypothetical protein